MIDLHASVTSSPKQVAEGFYEWTNKLNDTHTYYVEKFGDERLKVHNINTSDHFFTTPFKFLQDNYKPLTLEADIHTAQEAQIVIDEKVVAVAFGYKNALVAFEAFLDHLVDSIELPAPSEKHKDYCIELFMTSVGVLRSVTVRSLADGDWKEIENIARINKNTITH